MSPIIRIRKTDFPLEISDPEGELKTNPEIKSST